MKELVSKGLIEKVGEYYAGNPIYRGLQVKKKTDDQAQGKKGKKEKKPKKEKEAEAEPVANEQHNFNPFFIFE